MIANEWKNALFQVVQQYEKANLLKQAALDERLAIGLLAWPDPTFRNFMNLAFFLEDLFGRRVDLLTPEGISHRIRPNVEKEVVWAD